VSEHWDINEAVVQAFVTPEQGENYIDRILICCQDAGTRIRRLLILLILCMALFELLNRAAVDKITLSFIEVNDPASVATFLPVVVAYLEYVLVRQMLYWRSLERTFAAVIAVVQPEVAKNQLASYLVPTVPLFSNRQPKGAAFANVFSFQERTDEVFAALCAFLLPTFQFYALSQLFSRTDGRLTITFIVAASMTIIITIAYLVVIGMLVSNIIHWWFYETFIREDSSVRRRLLALGRRIRSARSD
jgi:hypothetical protein